jgi:hypothetical protein
VLSKTTCPKGPKKGTAAPGVGAQDGGWTTEAASKATSRGTVLRPHSRVKPEDRRDLVPHPMTERRARRPCISCRLRHYQPAGARPRGRRGEADRNGGHLANAFQDLSRSNYSVHGWVRNKKGAAGIDDMTVDELGAHPKEHWPEIRAHIVRGTYRPQPVRRLKIAVLSGSGLAAPEASARQGREEALDGVDPGGRGRGEVEHAARMTREPSQHTGVLVDRINFAGRAGRNRAPPSPWSPRTPS